MPEFILGAGSMLESKSLEAIYSKVEGEIERWSDDEDLAKEPLGRRSHRFRKKRCLKQKGAESLERRWTEL
jgi:hypothetical protein